MKVVILAGGYGTRLYELGKNTPKALLRIQNRYLIDFLLEKVRDFKGVKEVIIVTNNRFYRVFLQWAKKQTGYAHPLRIVNDGTNTPEDRLGSIGDIDFVIRRETTQDDLLVIGGDNLFADALGPYIRFARKNAPEATIGLYDIRSREAAKRFGVAGVDRHHRICSFVEKPSRPRSTLIAMCLYYLPKKSLRHITDYLLESGKSDTAGDYIRWLSQKSDVYGFQFSGKWYDIGSFESYREAQTEFKVS